MISSVLQALHDKERAKTGVQNDANASPLQEFFQLPIFDLLSWLEKNAVGDRLTTKHNDPGEHFNLFETKAYMY